MWVLFPSSTLRGRVLGRGNFLIVCLFLPRAWIYERICFKMMMTPTQLDKPKYSGC
jgi:hypothetical protein